MGDKPSEAPKKMKFTPKIPARRNQRHIEAKREASEDDDALNEELLKRVKENFSRSRPKFEKKLEAQQVASFGPSGARTHAMSFGTPGDSSSSKYQLHVFGDGHQNEPLAPRTKKEYVEPWDYYSHYPTVLPLRRPHSGNPEILNRQEFDEALTNAYDESNINSSEELGMMMEEKHPEILFFQLPTSLPMVKRPAYTKSKESEDRGKPSTEGSTSKEGCRLEELPAGFMGKILVYKSGAVKMKLGDALFDVSPGEKCAFAQDIAAINAVDKHCCLLGEINKHAIVTPDVDSLLNGIENLE